MENNNIQITDTLTEDIKALTETYINTLNSPDDIYNNKGCINGLLKYLYENYVGDLLNNKTYRDANRYDIKTLDKLWSIYTSIIYKYQTIQPRITIVQFCVFTGICRDTIYKYKEGIYKGVTSEYVSTVKKWENECQSVLLGDDSIKSIFILKSCYGYTETLPVVVENKQGTIEKLPDLNGNSNIIEQIAQKESET